MVLPLLLSDPSTVLRYGDLGRIVLQCLHEVHSMERALSIFHDALGFADLAESSTPPASPYHSFSAFDAHVGDCACQTRAQIFWDLVFFYRSENRTLLRLAATHLREIRVSAALLLEEIELSQGKPRNPNLTALTNLMAIRERINFQAFQDLAAMTSRKSSPSSSESSESSGTSVTSGASASKMPRQKSAHRRRDVTLEAACSPHDIVFVTRFLTMCNLLSDFKVAEIEAGPPIRLRVRVDLRQAYDRNTKEMEDLKLTGDYKVNYRIKANERMTRQVEAMQIYISRVTVDWAKQAAIRDSWPSFPEEFIATSERRIACVSSYASLLLVRSSWIKQDIPIFVIIQHFCSHGGYRNIYCRILKNAAAEISGNQYSAIGDGSWFRTEILSLAQVDSAPWTRTPHIVMIGMSCQGTIEDFRIHLAESQRGLLPLDHRCDQADNCALSISRTSIPRLLAHFFAQHEQFPFALPGSENEYERVGHGLNSCFGKEAEAVFTEARLGADEFGTGRSTGLATLEHVFLEYPSIVARDVEEYGEKPRVLGCKLK